MEFRQKKIGLDNKTNDSTPKFNLGERLRKGIVKLKNTTVGLGNKLFGLSDDKLKEAIVSADTIETLKEQLCDVHRLGENQIEKIINKIIENTTSKINTLIDDKITNYDTIPDPYVVCANLRGIAPQKYVEECFKSRIEEITEVVNNNITSGVVSYIETQKSLPLFTDIQLSCKYPTELAKKIFKQVLEDKTECFYGSLKLNKETIYDVAVGMPQEVLDAILSGVDKMRSLGILPSAVDPPTTTLTEIVREYTRLSSTMMPALMSSYYESQSRLLEYVDENVISKPLCDKLSHFQTIYMMGVQVAMLIDIAAFMELRLDSETLCRVGSAVLVVIFQMLHNECKILKLVKTAYSAIVGVADFICDAPSDVKCYLPSCLIDYSDENRVTWHKDLGKLIYTRNLGIKAAVNMVYCFRVGNVFIKTDTIPTTIDDCCKIFSTLSPIPLRSETREIIRLYEEDLYSGIKKKIYTEV